MKRSRRGGRRSQGGTSGHSNSGGNSFNPNRVYDSSGPEIKIRGTASHVYEKYLQLARDANASGDRIMAENYLQHAEHYFRIMAAVQAQQAAQQAAQPQPAVQQAEPMDDDEGAAPAPAPRPQKRNAPGGIGEQPMVGNDAGPSFSLNESSSAGEDAMGELAGEPVED